MTNNNRLRVLGEATYGSQWVAAVARDLDTSLRTVQRWATSAHDVPDGVIRDMLAVASRRIETINAAIAACKQE